MSQQIESTEAVVEPKQDNQAQAAKPEMPMPKVEPKDPVAEKLKAAEQELKALRAEREALAAEKVKSEEEKMRAAQDWKGIAEAKERALAEKEKKLAEIEAREAERAEREREHVKLRAVLSGVNGTVPKKYMGHIDTSMIAIDPETGQPDALSVQQAIKKFENEHPEIILPKQPKLPPNHAPKGGSVDVTAEINNAKSQAELEAILKKHGKRLG